jgi:glycosyltransferase involved in cell wall biosynthesis
MKIAIVIPLFNEALHVESLLKELNKFPVIVVDDGSDDGSAYKVEKLKLKNVTLLRHKINLGKGATMKTGADFAFKSGFEAVIFMDSDGQHKAGDLSKFMVEIETNKYDIVYGVRKMNKNTPIVRSLGNKLASIMCAILFNSNTPDVLCGFRGITKNAYKKIRWESSGYGVEIEMIARAGKNRLKSSEIQVQTVYINRVKGVTLLDAFGILGEVVKWKLTI